MTEYETMLDNWYLEQAYRYTHESVPCPNCNSDVQFVGSTDYDPESMICPVCGYNEEIESDY